MLFTVRSRCKREADSGRNSARAMAPAEVSWVDERKRRLRAVLSVNAVRNDWILRGRCQKRATRKKETEVGDVHLPEQAPNKGFG